MKRKHPVYKGLDKVPVLYTDTSEYSPELFVITEFPTQLTSGKNILKLRGNFDTLKQYSIVDVEILDYNQNPIYFEITPLIATDKSRIISIYIYEDTPYGEVTITLLTEAEIVNKQIVPTEWKGKSNVKWTGKTICNPVIENISEILFDTLPSIEITEQLGVHLDRLYNTTQYLTYSTGTVTYRLQNNQALLSIENGSFTSDMTNGTVTITTPVNPTPTPLYTSTIKPYTTKIKKVLNTKNAVLESPYMLPSATSIIPHQYNKFEASAFTIDYEETPTYSLTQNSESFALIKINNLQPMTGDISRIKVYVNNAGTIGTWETISDIELLESEIFVTNTASISPDKSIGLITSQSIINTYYTASAYHGNTRAVAPTITYDNIDLINSMHIVSNIDLTNESSVAIVQISSSFKGNFLEDASYKLIVDAYSPSVNGLISVYISGSAYNYNTTDYLNRVLPINIGRKIGQISVAELGSRINDYKISFESDNIGDGVLIFVIEQGEWYISDIRTTSDNDLGYTPNYTRIRSYVPTSHKSDVQLSFKVEYYNKAGVKCKQTNYVNNIPWQGGNRYIDGDYSMLTGSLYVADSLNSGIAISGYSNSGFVRSLGYNGFNAGAPGFLLWSGSAMQGSAGSKGGVPYSGVGLEMYANSNNYFRYSTSDSELDIRTDKIYIGNSSTFISASNGNLQISSSNFSINANGDVTASNLHLDNVAYADGFVYETVIIDDSNYTQYYVNYTIDNINVSGSGGVTKSFTKLLLDGSLGGESGRQVRIERLPDYPIGTILPPGYTYQSDKGFDITIENFALHIAGGFSALAIAAWVAENDSNVKGIADFGFGADMWDVASNAYATRRLNYGSIYSETGLTDLSVYGENPIGEFSTYNTSAGESHSAILLMYYGSQYTFQRSTYKTGVTTFQTGFWQLMSYDSINSGRPYFAYGAKFGNTGVLIGGNGNLGVRASAIHYTEPHLSAVLQLDARTDLTNGSSSVFLPPRVTTAVRDYNGSPINGSVIYNTTDNKLQVYNGSGWQDCF